MSLQHIFIGAVLAVAALSATNCQAGSPPPLRFAYLSGAVGEIDPCG